MNPVLQGWRKSTREARLELLIGERFDFGLGSEEWPNPVSAWCSAARALVILVGERHASVAFEPGISAADVRRGLTNLDGTLLKGLGSDADASERLIGVAAHEGAHLAWSAPPRRSWVPAYRWVHNLVEDERIERKIARRYLRLAHPLYVARRDLLEIDPDESSFFGALFAMVRAPDRLSAQQWTRHERRLLKLISILTPFPGSQAAVTRCVARIVQLLTHPELLSTPAYPELVLPGFNPATCRPGQRPLHERLRRLRRQRSRSDKDGLSREAELDPDWPPVRWEQVGPDPNGYETIRREVAGPAALLRQLLQPLLPPRRESHRRRGTLDRRRLFARELDDRLFLGPNLARDALSIALILDMSASMDGSCAEKAQHVAVLLSEAVIGLPGVRLYVYGHSADRDHSPCTQITRFATPARGPVLTLGHFNVDGNNRDAHALHLIGDDLQRMEPRSRSRRIAVILADGVPHAMGFSGPEAFEATRRALLWLDQAWGPTVFLATEEHERLRDLASGPYLVLQDKNSFHPLVSLLSGALRRC
ncbi:MAG: hypothetical protein E2O73_00545 [Deltaproteobacteria bacterium]|nr:MAG: hypothetical protein E2O73_00545 [Deltaproteobacteria bacterium]